MFTFTILTLETFSAKNVWFPQQQKIILILSKKRPNHDGNLYG